MLRLTQSSNAFAVRRYFVSRAEYYAAEQQEQPGIWGGDAAARLGLFGEVEQRDFDRLCDNRHPQTGEQLTPRQRQDRRVGYDFTFNACKSASILYGLTADADILAAFRASVHATMRDIEAEMKTRVRRGGRYEDRRVANAAWADHLHFTARQVDGLIDPHLHSHCFMFNLVFDFDEGRFKAGQFGDIKRNAGKFQRAFHERFAQNLAALGYPIERHASGWEIAGFPPALLKKFSRRTEQIEQVAESLGITADRHKAELGALTRERKRRDLTMAELRREWRSRLSDSEQAILEAATIRRSFTADSGFAGFPDLAGSRGDVKRPHASQRPFFARRRQQQVMTAELAAWQLPVIQHHAR